MALKRYSNRKIKYNTEELIQKILDRKNILAIKHYGTPSIKIPTYLDKINIQTTSEIWKRGDRLYKYAEIYYSNPELWWIIALYNNKPTDAHFTIGEVFYIPTNLANLFEYTNI